MKPLRLLACTAILLAVPGVHAAALASADAGAALLARYASLAEELRDNAFRRPLHLDSTEASGGLSGEIYALVDAGYAIVNAELVQPAQWCAIMNLHLNTKSCKVSADAGADVLHVRIGKKFDQPADLAYPVDFTYRVTAATPEYLQVKLEAAQGPLGTSNYRIVLEAAPTGDGRTFIHLGYSYSYGMMAQIAMQAYLATIGRNKVGFTIVGKDPGGAPLYIRGMRGVVERNTMRYYLAIEAFIGALSAPAPARAETSLRAWFAAIEGYPRQLHEMEEGDYLAMKRREHSSPR